MKVNVDHDRCEGHGLCGEAAPALFELDDEGDLALRFPGTVPPGEEYQANQAIQRCPVSALRQVE